MIESNTVISRNSSVLFSDLDDKILMMSIDKGTYYSLDEVGTRIWGLIENPASVEELCEVLLTEFEVEPETCRQDVLNFMSEMSELEVISISKEKI